MKNESKTYTGTSKYDTDTIEIDTLIELLAKYKKQGATKIILAGRTVIENSGNSVILTTEPQWWQKN